MVEYTLEHFLADMKFKNEVIAILDKMAKVMDKLEKRVQLLEKK